MIPFNQWGEFWGGKKASLFSTTEITPDQRSARGIEVLLEVRDDLEP